jgi:4-hydroxy-tetrahydrodipicolinate synthase
VTASRDPHIAGVVPAVITPFNDDLSIDFPTLEKYVAWVAEARVGAIFCSGHAGEVAALSHPERKELIATVVSAVGGKVPVLAGNYADSLEDAIATGIDAREAGADALTIFPPPNVGAFGDDLIDDEMVVNWHKAVTEGAELPGVLFLYRRNSNSSYSREALARLADMDSIVAIKEGSGLLPEYEANYKMLSQLDPPLPVLSTNNSWLLSSLAVGGDGIMSGAGSIIARQQVELWEAVQNLDLARAREVNDQLYQLNLAFYQPHFINMHSRMKEGLVMMGIIPNATPRPPLLPISEDVKAQIRAGLVAAGLLEEGN